MNNTKGFNVKNKPKLNYPVIQSSTLPVPHSDDRPVAIQVYTGLPDDDILFSALTFYFKLMI